MHNYLSQLLFLHLQSKLNIDLSVSAFVRLSLIRLVGQNIGRWPIEHEEEHKYFLQPLQGRKD